MTHHHEYLRGSLMPPAQVHGDATRHLDSTTVLTMSQSGLYYAISFTLSFLGCYAATQLTEQLRIMKRQPSRILGAGSTMVLLSLSLGGVAVWVMHLTSLATMVMALPNGERVTLSFGSGLTALSLLISSVASILGTYIASRDRFFYKSKAELGEIMKDAGEALTLREVRKSGTLVRQMLTKNLESICMGGFVTGGGFCTMHYVGLLAAVFPGNLRWNPGAVAASALIGWIGATVAFWILFRFLTLYPDKETYRIASAAVMAVAVCGMHYVGMVGTVFVYTGVAQTTVTLEVSAGNTIVTAVLVGLTFLWAAIMVVIGDLRAYFYSRVAIINSLERLLRATSEACTATGRDNINIHVLLERYEQLKSRHQIRGQLSVDVKQSTGGRASSVAAGDGSGRKQSVHQKLIARLMGRRSSVAPGSGGGGSVVADAVGGGHTGARSGKSSGAKPGDPSTRHGHSMSPLTSHQANPNRTKTPAGQRSRVNSVGGGDRQSPSAALSGRQSINEPVSTRSAADGDALVDRVAEANTRYTLRGRISMNNLNHLHESAASGGGGGGSSGGGGGGGGGGGNGPAPPVASDVQYGEFECTNIPFASSSAASSCENSQNRPPSPDGTRRRHSRVYSSSRLRVPSQLSVSSASVDQFRPGPAAHPHRTSFAPKLRVIPNDVASVDESRPASLAKVSGSIKSHGPAGSGSRNASKKGSGGASGKRPGQRRSISPRSPARSPAHSDNVSVRSVGDSAAIIGKAFDQIVDDDDLGIE